MLTDRSVIKIMSPRAKNQLEQMRQSSTSRILEAALALFAEEGYDRTSMASIAKKAKVSKGLIYNYFESKEDLLKELVTYIMEDDSLTYWVENIEKKTPKETLRQMIDFIFDYIKEHPYKLMLITKLSLEVGQLDFLQDMINAKVEFYHKILIDIFKDLGYEDPVNEAYIVGLIGDGLTMQAIALKDKFWFDEYKKALYLKYDL